MLEFSALKRAMQAQFHKLCETGAVFRMDVDRDLLWETYINSFPPGTNPTFRERTEHDCAACKSFIRHAGAMVAIKDGELISLWDFEIGDRYQPVVDALSALVKAADIHNVFLHSEPAVGVDKNYEQPTEEDRPVTTWEHLYVRLPDALHCRGADIGTKESKFRSTFDVMLRGLQELTIDAVETVLELIGQNSLYRGEEHQKTLQDFLVLKKAFDKAPNSELFCWSRVRSTSPVVSRVRNTSIGQLLIDLSGGRALEEAVTAFEAIVAPTNYKRPKALVTKAMIDRAKEKVEKLGLTSALGRRFAILKDVSITDVLFADRSAQEQMADVFDEVKSETPDKVPDLDRVEEVSVDTFLREVLPKAEQLSLMVENTHAPNFVSLIAPMDPNSATMFKWSNRFSWTYAGELTDSIKERVKQAGGSVTGDLRCSLSWFNTDDLDLHMIEAGGNHIYFSNKRSHGTGGSLDVDMNAGGRHRTDPVENITYPSRGRMEDGIYKLFVNQYTVRNSSNVGFEVEIEFDGQVHHFSYPKRLTQKENVQVAEIQLKNGEFKITKAHLDSNQTPRTIWGVQTRAFQRVETVMLSPNHWDGQVGNRHVFFFLEGCKNEGKARGFFNEFLTQELEQHRKVLEIVGAKVQVADSDDQLSGLGFSSTKRNTVLCRVRGSFKRDLKIVF